MKYYLGSMLLLGSVSAFACEGKREYIKSSCFQFPEIDEGAIQNEHGDQSALRNSDRYLLYYPYIRKEEVELVVDTPEGKTTSYVVHRQQNEAHNFNGESVAVVKNMAKNYIRSRKALQCK